MVASSRLIASGLTVNFVSLGKTLYLLLSTVQPKKTKNHPDMTEKLLTGT